MSMVSTVRRVPMRCCCRRGACWPIAYGAVPRCHRLQAVKDHLRLELGVLEHEVFCVLFLDAQHRIIALKQMFRGTVSQTSVYPREVVKEALSVNAAAVILAHNHPSGSVEPSRADEFLTQTLKTALALVDVRVLDHLVVAGADVCSFAERGLV
jgi:DNA repair protein RadC